MLVSPCRNYEAYLVIFDHSVLLATVTAFYKATLHRI